MTVGELIARLQQFDASLTVTGLWDTIPDWEVHRVEQYYELVVIDVGEGPNGDWNVVSESAPSTSESD